jgi:hypothetical protein
MRPLEGLRDGVFVNLLQIEHEPPRDSAPVIRLRVTNDRRPITEDQ